MATGSGAKDRRPRWNDRQSANVAEILNLRVPVRKLITVNAVGAAVGFGFAGLDAKIPKGDFILLGGVAWLRFEESPLSANIIDTWEGDFSLGTVGTVDVDLADAGEANILASTALGPATAGVLARARYAIPGSTTPVNNNALNGALFLNLLIDAASVTDGTTPTVLVSGNISLAIAPLGFNA